jgi:hypothetical protein
MNEKKQNDPKNDQEVSSFEISDNGPAKYRELMLKNQKMSMAILGGIAAGIIGIIVWIGAFLIGYKIDLFALGVGYFIGFGSRYLGKAVEPKFGYVAGAIAFLFVFIGDEILGCLLFAKSTHVSIFSILSNLTPSTGFFVLKAVLGPVDILFWLAAIGLAYYFSFKPLKQQV